ncbi:hypothetical protein DFH29DRAFT_1045098 [Suillus ampliporus]|nr:hypothetical protein DFH29DRAFT_1045098 [Suillus ampliporus]
MGHNPKKFKSAEFIDDSDSSNDDGSVLDISSSSDSDSSGSSTAFGLGASIFNFDTRDSVDCELDAMPAPPPVIEPIPVTEPLQAPSKVKSKKKKSKQPQPATLPPNEPEVIPIAPPRIEATYSIMILPYGELKKDDIKKRVGTATILSLYLDEPFNTFKAQVLRKIEKETNPTILSFENYKTFFTIVRIAPQPTSLADEDDYHELIKRLQRTGTPAATIYIQELSAMKKRKDRSSDKENDGERNKDENRSSSESSDDGKKRKPKKKKKKTKAPKANDIDEEMKPINKNIKALSDRFTSNPTQEKAHNTVTYTRPRRTAKHDNVPIETGHPMWAHGKNCTLIDRWAKGVEIAVNPVYDGDGWANRLKCNGDTWAGKYGWAEEYGAMEMGGLVNEAQWRRVGQGVWCNGAGWAGK